MGGFAVFILLVLFLLLFARRCWNEYRYLRWQWRAISYYEQQDRLRKGLCVHCGYDLRGTPDRCPECGKPASAMK